MEEKRIFKPPKKLYHLSHENHDNEWFKPRVPDSIAYSYTNSSYNEDDKTKRVCFSTSISRAFFAINFDGHYETLYVHIPLNVDEIAKKGKLCIPTEKQVFDVYTTNERWIKCKVRLKCIGKIRIGYKTDMFSEKFSFKWIEKYI